MPADPDRPTTVASALALGRERLARAGVPESRADAEWLLARLLDTDRGGLLVRRNDTLATATAGRFRAWLARRERREPLQRIAGTEEFYGRILAVDGPVLIPRPETEGVVDAILGLDLRPRARVADLGTGSGCIIVALGAERDDLELHALDRSPAALDVARRNARRHGLLERVDFREADLARPPAEWRGRMDVVACNPPYVTEDEWKTLEPEVRDHDPREALVAGPTGLEAYRTLAPSARELLAAGGRLVTEIGFGQAGPVRTLLAAAGLEVVDERADLRGIPRVLVARCAEGSAR